MAGMCGDCTGCCVVFEVKDVPKACGEKCKHLGNTLFGVGCTIYDARPQPCKNYVCLWLDSQRRTKEVERMPEALRPENCKVVMGWPWGVDRETLFIYPYPGHEDAWRKQPVAEHLRLVLSRGGKIVIVMPNANQRIALKGDVALVGTEEEFAELLF